MRKQCFCKLILKPDQEQHEKDMKFRWKQYPVELRFILSIYSIGFLIGTYTHLQAILIHGFLGQNAPLFYRIYWDSLIFFDPLAAVIVWIKPKWGIRLAILIMVTDILINCYAYTSGIFMEPVPGMIPTFLFLQALFGTYIFITAPLVLGKLKKHRQL